MKNGVTYLIGFVLFMGILFLMPNGIDPRVQRITGFTLSMLIISGLYVFARIDKLLGAFILYVCAISWQMVYFDPQFFYMLFALIIFLIWVIKTKELKTEVIYDVLVSFACLNLIFQEMQFFDIQFIVGTRNHEICGLMSHENESSALYAIVAPVFFRKNRWYFLPVIIAGLVFSHSFQGVVAFAVVSTLWLFLNTPIKRSIAITVIILLLIVCYGIFVKPFDFQTYNHQRLNLWEQSVKASTIKPLFGWGFNQYHFVIPLITSYKYLSPEDRGKLFKMVIDKKAFASAIKRITNKDKDFLIGNKQLGEAHDKAHNEYIEWLFVGGFIGLTIGVLFLGHIIWESYFQWDKVPFYGLISAVVVCMFGFSWHLMPLILITVFYIALAERNLCLHCTAHA